MAIRAAMSDSRRNSEVGLPYRKRNAATVRRVPCIHEFVKEA